MTLNSSAAGRADTCTRNQISYQSMTGNLQQRSKLICCGHQAWSDRQQ